MSDLNEFPLTGQALISQMGRRIARLERSMATKARASAVAAQGAHIRDLLAAPGGSGTPEAVAATANALALRDASGRTQVATPSVAADAANKAYVDGLTTPGAWQTVTLNSGFATPSGYPVLQYRIMPDGEWQWKGRVSPSSGNFTANAANNVGTVASGHEPAHQLLSGTPGSAGGTWATRMWVETDGSVNCAVAGAASALDFNSVRLTPGT